MTLVVDASVIVAALVDTGPVGVWGESVLSLCIELFPYVPFAARVWGLRENVTAYDAWYVALAESLGVGLATLDPRLSRAPGAARTFVTPPLR